MFAPFRPLDTGDRERSQPSEKAIRPVALPRSLRRARPLLGPLFILLVWQNVAFAARSPLLPGVEAVAAALWPMLLSGELLRHAAVSLQTVLLGYGAAVGCGLALGVLMAQSSALRAALMPAVDAMRPIAALSFFPLLILLFGIGQTSKAVVIFWTAWPAVLLSTTQGLLTVDRATVEAASIDGAGRWRVLHHISLPLALPAILTGMRIGMSGGWIGLVSAEMLGSSAGLGHAVLAYGQSFQFGAMYAVIAIIALCGLLLNQLLLCIQTYVERTLL